MRTLTRLKLTHEIDELARFVLGKERDRYAPIDQELSLLATMLDTWQGQVHQAARELQAYLDSKMFERPQIGQVDDMMKVLDRAFKGPAITSRITDALDKNVRSAYSSAQEEVDREEVRQTGKSTKVKDRFGFGVLFGITEGHAIQALNDFGILSAGGFWEASLSESVRDQMLGWYEGDLNRAQLTTNLKSLVNDRLSIDGKNSMPRSYYKGLSEHLIVRTRNIGKFYRGKSLGVKNYRFRNPNDHRTSTICSKLHGKVYSMADAESVVTDVLGASSLDDLKRLQPFWKNPNEDRVPVPPIHWKCRSWIEMVFAEIENVAGLPSLDPMAAPIGDNRASERYQEDRKSVTLSVDRYGNLVMRKDAVLV